MKAPFQSLSWYNLKVDRHTDVCGDTSLICFPSDDLPHIQFNEFGIIRLHGETGGVEDMPTIIETVDGVTYTNYIGSTAFGGFPQPLDGEFYFTFTSGSKILFSDKFKVVNPDCIRWKLEWSNCSNNGINYDGVFNQCLYFKDIKATSPIYEEQIDGKENGDGVFTPSFQRLDKYDGFTVLGNCALHCALKGLTFHDTIKLTDIRSSCETELKAVSISGIEDSCDFPITLNYKQCDLESDQCCDSAFKDEVFVDPCDTTPGEDCPEDFEVLFEPDGSGNVIATVNNAPGPVTYAIYINGQLQGTSSSINLTEYGTYEVRAFSEGCEVTDSYQYNDPCANFSVDLVVNGDKIDGAINGVPTGDSVIVSICDDTGTEVGTALPFTAPDPGVYTVKVTTDPTGCEIIQNVAITDPLTCDFDFTVEKDAAGTLSPSFITPCSSTPSYQWYQITNGDDRTPVGTNISYTPTVTGQYILGITCDTCYLERSFVCVIEDCLNVVIKEMPDQNITVDIGDIELGDVTIDLGNIENLLQGLIDQFDCLDINVKNLVKVCIPYPIGEDGSKPDKLIDPTPKQ